MTWPIIKTGITSELITFTLTLHTLKKSIFRAKKNSPHLYMY